MLDYMGKITDISYMHARPSSPCQSPAADADPARSLPPFGRERRRHERQQVFTAGVIFPPGADDDSHRRAIYVFNVSCGGIGFRSQSHFDEGSTHGVRIGSGPLHLSGSVRILSCRVRPDGACDVGAQFL